MAILLKQYSLNIFKLKELCIYIPHGRIIASLVLKQLSTPLLLFEIKKNLIKMDKWVFTPIPRLFFTLNLLFRREDSCFGSYQK